MTKIPLVLCPGLLCDAALWRHQVDSLGDLVDPVVADFSQADSMAAMAASVLDRAPPLFALAGLSMGGYVAFEILRRAPERVLRLALFDTSARPDTPEASQKRLDRIAIAEAGGFSRLPPLMLPDLLHPDHVGDRVLGDTVLGMAQRIGPEAFVRQQTAIMNRPDSRPGLPAIAVPTLVACGRQDSLTPLAVMGEIAAGIPGAKYVIIEESGHLSPIEQPQAATAVLRYWLQD